MKRLDDKTCIGKTIQHCLTGINAKLLIVFQVEPEFEYLEVGSDDNYGEGSYPLIVDDGQFDPFDYYQDQLINAGITTLEEMDAIRKANREKVFQQNLENDRLTYERLKKSFEPNKE